MTWILAIHFIAITLPLFISVFKPVAIYKPKKLKVYSVREQDSRQLHLTSHLQKKENNESSFVASSSHTNKISDTPKSVELKKVNQKSSVKKVETVKKRVDNKAKAAKPSTLKQNKIVSSRSNTSRERVEETLAKIEKQAYNDRLQLESRRLHELENSKVEEGLIEFLQNLLILPEIGEVKVQLCINSNGTIGQMKTIKSESERNKQYLEEKLTSLKVPFVLPADKVITVTFCNDV